MRELLDLLLLGIAYGIKFTVIGIVAAFCIFGIVRCHADVIADGDLGMMLCVYGALALFVVFSLACTYIRHRKGH